MPRKHNYRRMPRGLRFRLTFSYALFFAVLLAGVAALFRARLASTLDDQAKTVVEQEWAAMKGYLRIEKNQNTQQNDSWWYWDPDDSDESRIVLNIQRMYLIADSNGNVIHDGKSGEDAVSSAYMEIGVDPPAEIRSRIREAMAGNRPNAPPIPLWTVRRSRQG